MVQDSVNYRSAFAELARLSVTGKPADASLYLTRMARRVRALDGDMAEELLTLLRQGGARAMVRREPGVPVPVDAESRLHLVRTEWPSLSDVAPILDPSVSRMVGSLVRERQMASDLAAAGLVPSKSALFVGPPGVGKTMSARWVAASLGLPLLVLDLAAVMSSFLGKTGNNLRSVLEYAKRQDCVLLLDELDSIAKRRDDSTEIGELKRLVTVLLQEIDEWPASGLLIAATNHGELLDPAVWRRFDVLVEFRAPNFREVREATVRFLGGEFSTAVETWVDAVAASFVGKSYSDIERGLAGVRRRAIVAGVPLEDELRAWMQSVIENLSFDAKVGLAKRLSASGGVSQRQIAEITGLSRDTVKKYSAIGVEK